MRRAKSAKKKGAQALAGARARAARFRDAQRGGAWALGARAPALARPKKNIPKSLAGQGRGNLGVEGTGRHLMWPDMALA